MRVASPDTRREKETTQVRLSAPLCILALLLGLAAVDARGQQSDAGQSLTVRSTLVQVPVLVKTHRGQVILGLTANDFLLTDDGVPQVLTLDRKSTRLNSSHLGISYAVFCL